MMSRTPGRLTLPTLSAVKNALDQGAAIDPLLTGMPAFHSGWVQDVLTHIANTQSQGIETGLGKVNSPTRRVVPTTVSTGLLTLAKRAFLKNQS